MHAASSVEASQKSSLSAQGPEADSEKKDLNDIEHVEELAGVTSDHDDSIEDAPPSRAVWLITFTVAMGGFLFGYDTGYISAVLVTIGSDLGHELSSKEKELVTSVTSGGALIGALFAGIPADRYGRKLGIYIGCFLFLAGTVIQASAFSVPQMTVGRFVVGVGVGSAAMIVPLYIGELAPAKYRGRMIAFNNMCVTLGQLVSYGLGAGFTEVIHGWRFLVAVGGIPPIVLSCLLPFCPETPRQLICHSKIEEAKRVIAKVYPHATPEQVDGKAMHIQTVIQDEAHAMADKSVWWQFKQLHCVPSNLRALISACTIMAISQLGGFNTLMYYSGTLFGLVGFKKPTVVSLVVGGTNFVFSAFNILIIDKLGRRKILLFSVIGMSVAMAITAVAFKFIPVSSELELEVKEVNWAGTLVLVMIIFYIAFYAGGVATIAWVGTELLPMEVRALGTMMNTVTCWGCNLIIASTFLSMMKAITPSGAFGFYSGICFCGWLFIVFCYPEVRGLPLEDIRQIFDSGFGVRRAAKMQKELKQQRK